MTDRKTDRFLYSHQKERERLAQKEEKLEAERKALARAQAASEDQHEIYHRMKLAYYDRQAGFEGRHADARDELRRLSVADYCKIVQEGIADPARVTLVAAELAAVEKHLDFLTGAANKRYLARDEAEYREVQAKWEEHHRSHPNAGGWRAKAATREQWILIDRIVSAIGVDRPGKMTRGQAHDWIHVHGGNPRYGAGGPTAQSPDDRRSGAASNQASEVQP